MKVLFQIRKDYLRNIAGDSIIFLNIRENLIKQGVKVDICTDANINPISYDLIHIFNTVRIEESYEFVMNAKKYKKKIILHSIYWDLKQYFNRTNQLDKLQLWMRAETKRKIVFNNTDLIISHCRGEKELIEQNYGTDLKFSIIPYGTDISLSKEKDSYIKSKLGFDEFVLCVGRISRQKNQISLIRALSKENIPIVLVGSINDRDYYKQCIHEGKERVVILDDIKTGQLDTIYNGARVHVLPSWIEYPGLASLEAGIAGCNVVSTEVGSTKEVFQDYVNYCNPNDMDSIYHQTMKAFETPHSEEFKNFIIENYLWTKAAAKIKNIYHSVIEPR